MLQVGDQASTLCYLVEGRACMDATFIRPDVQRAIEFPIQLLTMGLEWYDLPPLHGMNNRSTDSQQLSRQAKD